MKRIYTEIGNDRFWKEWASAFFEEQVGFELWIEEWKSGRSVRADVSPRTEIQRRGA